MNFTITENLDDPRIIPFLMRNNNSAVYHHPAWLRALSEIYNYPAFYMIWENSNTNETTGVFPFIVKKKFGKNKKIISLPSTTHCEPLLPDNFDFNIIIKELKSYFGKDLTEFDFKFKSSPSIRDFTTTSNYFVHIIELCPNLEDTFNSFGKRSIRRFIRKSDENGLKFRIGNNENDLKIFYEIEKKLRKSIGLPPAPYKFFKTIWQYLEEDNLILLPIIEFQNKPIAASMVLKFKDTFYFEYTATDKKYIDLYPNHKLLWEAIKIAQEEYNAKYIDMGRTAVDQESLIYFKEKWNAKAFPLHRLSFPAENKSSLKRGTLFKNIKNFNKILPSKILEFEGKVLFRFFD